MRKERMIRLAALALSCALMAGCAAAPAISGDSAQATDAVVELTPEVTPTADPTPTPSPTPLPGKPYIVCANEAHIRKDPKIVGAHLTSENNNILELLYYEEAVRLLDDAPVMDGDIEFVHVLLVRTGQLGWIYSKLIVPESERLYAYALPSIISEQKVDLKGNPVFSASGPVMVTDDLVDMRRELPDAYYNLLFATENNITGAPLYARAIPLMQRGTLEKLVKAYDMFKADGYTIMVYDAYRPLSVQRILYDIVQNPHWIANPDTTASNHNKGCAIDMSLIGPDGVELEFPTPMHTFSEEAARNSKSWSAEARANVDYMTKIMKKCGFNSINSEWWHFSDTNSAKYKITDLDFSLVLLRPKDFEG